MVDRVEYGAWNGASNVPLCAMLDGVGLGHNASLAAGVTRQSSPIECTGMRRYRLKCLQLTGAGPSAVNAQDMPFGPAAAAIWQNAVLAAAQATATRSVYNFGEGTGVMECFMGPYLIISLTNNGIDAATSELELWMQS